MTGWHAAHLFVLGAWGGLVLGELVIEAIGRRDPLLRAAVARMHRSIDLFVEVPLLVAVLVTGAVLLMRHPAPDAALWIKVGLGAGAVAVNLACVWVVLRRHRLASGEGDPAAVDRWTTWVFRSAGVGVPLALVALYMGGQRTGWW